MKNAVIFMLSIGLSIVVGIVVGTHKAEERLVEYDKKYESTPERVKYREDLNRERRRRGIYGSHDHKDVSHTKGGKLTLEGEHENRARHFKEKGTLRDM